MSISVAIGTHNGARFLTEQLTSILDQTEAPDEIVLSDDASTDGTAELAERIVAEHAGSTRLVVLRNPTPLRVTANFAQAIAATTGDLVALSDQDDVWMPHRLERARAEFDARPALTLLHADARLVDEHGHPIGGTLLEAIEFTAAERDLYRAGAAFDALLRRNLVTGATTMFRRSLLESAAPLPPGWVHDEWLAIIAAATGEVDVIEAPLIDYRQHGGNQIGAARLSLAGKLRRMLEPRRARNDRLAANSAVLAERLENLDGVALEHRAAARQKAEHERVRHGYPASRWQRLGPVLRERRTGRYAYSARGGADVVRDLLQPVD